MFPTETTFNPREKYGERILEILKKSDLTTVSAKRVRNQLEEEDKISLKEYKEALDSVITEYFEKLQDGETNDKRAAKSDLSDESPKFRLAKAPKLTKKEETKLEKARRLREAKELKKQKRKEKNRKPPSRLNGFTAPQHLSPKLSAILKTKALSRPEVVKELWVYIKSNSLQDPGDGRVILCDDAFKDCFGVEKLTSFELCKLIGPHLTKMTPEELEPYQPTSLIPEMVRLSSSSPDESEMNLTQFPTFSHDEPF